MYAFRAVFGTIVYINTLLSTISDADDTTLVCCGKDPLTVASSMKSCNVQKWLVDSRMQLNLKKSCVIWFYAHH